ncbi:MAG TPA: CBS domain-containing protein [Patescibacteria group bacterium]|nr:CBS domain-containing protein [Patescibacteria group bacterium]
MKVRDAMTGSPVYCTAKTNLGEAAALMWSRDCGILPVVDAERRVVGVVTDRDMFLALGTRNRLAGELTVGEVCPAKPFLCSWDDDVRAALDVMAQHKVRRLPVTNAEGRLEGVLSMDDLVVHASRRAAGHGSELSYDDVIQALKKIYETRSPVIMYRASAGG